MFSIVMFGFKTNNECYFNVSCLEMLDKKGTGTVSELEHGVARPVFSLPRMALGPPTLPGYNPIISPSPGPGFKCKS